MTNCLQSPVVLSIEGMLSVRSAYFAIYPPEKPPAPKVGLLSQARPCTSFFKLIKLIRDRVRSRKSVTTLAPKKMNKGSLRETIKLAEESLPDGIYVGGAYFID